MTEEQILIVKRAVSNQIPGDGFGEFVRELIFGGRAQKPVAQIDWVKMTQLLAYHFPDLLIVPEFKEVYLQIQ